MKIDLDELVSIKVASEMRGVTTQAIHQLIKRGKLRAIEVSGIRFVLRKEVEAYEPDVGGRPRKNSSPDPSSQGAAKAKRSRASKTTPTKKKPSR
jgi:hypothetical protein